MGSGPLGEAGNIEEDRRMDNDGTGDTVMGRGEERGAPGDLPRDSRDRERDGRLTTTTPKKRRAGLLRMEVLGGNPCTARALRATFTVGPPYRTPKHTPSKCPQI